jgi:hypothetical protein
MTTTNIFNSTTNPTNSSSNNSLITLLPQNTEITIDGIGSIWLIVLTLDGSPLSGQNVFLSKNFLINYKIF